MVCPVSSGSLKVNIDKRYLNSASFLRICFSFCPSTFINSTPSHLAAYARNLGVILDTSHFLKTPSDKTLKACHFSRAYITLLIFFTITISSLVQATLASCLDDGHTSDLTIPTATTPVSGNPFSNQKPE